MCYPCTMVPGRSITNDKCDIKNKIYIQRTASCMVQEAVLLYNKLISICHLIGERIMTDLNIKNLSYVDNFKHSVVGNFINFSTRASRSEYWRFTAVTVVIGFVFTLLRFVFGHSFLGSLINLLSFAYTCVMFLPSLGIAVRRLHDINKSGWFWLIIFVPIIGLVYVIYLLAKPGDVGDNQYGSPTSYEVITAEEAARTGLKETPSESMDQKAMLACICLTVFNIWMSFSVL